MSRKQVGDQRDGVALTLVPDERIGQAGRAQTWHYERLDGLESELHSLSGDRWRGFARAARPRCSPKISIRAGSSGSNRREQFQ
jgi:hypothetical protein